MRCIRTSASLAPVVCATRRAISPSVASLPWAWKAHTIPSTIAFTWRTTTGRGPAGGATSTITAKGQSGVPSPPDPVTGLLLSASQTSVSRGPDAAAAIQRYRVGFCDVASPTNERTLVAALIPPGTICGDKVPTFTYPEGYEWAYAVWLAAANSFVGDFIARKKVSLKMALGVVDSLPFPRSSAHDATTRQLVPLVARLTCTSVEMLGYWQLLARDGFVDPVDEDGIPGELDEDRRLELRAQIDAIVAVDVYGTDREEVEFIMSTFPTAARYEISRYGEFRSAGLVLDAYDSIVSGRTPSAVSD